VDPDPDPAYHFDTDPDGAFQNDADQDPDPQHCLKRTVPELYIFRLFLRAYFVSDSIRYASGAGLRINYRRYPEQSYDLFAKVKMSKCGEIGTVIRTVYWELTRYGMEDERGLT
jgi:hypothetical protein